MLAMPSATVSPARHLRGRLCVPGDKSISHRYALLAALADGESRLSNYAPGAVFLGVDIQGNARVERVMLTPDRRRMREFSVISLLNMLRRTLSA